MLRRCSRRCARVTLARVKFSRLFASLTLGVWLGLYTLRSYIPSAVWNLSDELPLQMKAVLALGIEAIAVVGVLLVIKGRRRTLRPLAIAFAAVAVARQIFITSDAIGPWLALISPLRYARLLRKNMSS